MKINNSIVHCNIFKILITLIILLSFAGCGNVDIKFIRVIDGKALDIKRKDSSWYYETILVKNIPDDDLQQSKIMIAYFDSVALSTSNLLLYDFPKVPDIKYYNMSFYKSTYATRKFFIKMKDIPYEEKKGYTYNGNKTYLGNICMIRCKNDITKWRIEIDRNLGTTPDFEYTGPEVKTTILSNECDSNWYEEHQDDELVQYYLKLRRK